MLNIAPIIIRDAQDIETALSKIGLTKEIVANVAFAAAAARADSLSVDPSSAPGQLSYIHGVRAIRMHLLKRGWRMSKQGNVESTVNDEIGVQLFFQNVDIACNNFKSPSAISSKGAASRSLVAAGQGELFGSSSGIMEASVLGCTPVVWLVCVSVEGFSVRAEVSCPKIFEGTQYEGFHQRIFVLDKSFEPTIERSRTTDENTDTFDFDVKVSKK